MVQDLGSWHPLVVHFPIALLIASLLFDAVGWWWKRPAFTEAALGIQTLGVLGAIVAVITGNQAEEAVERIPGIHDVLEQHETLGQILLWAGLVVVALRFFFFWRRMLGQPTKAFLMVLSLGLAILVGVTGYYGGKLVYEFGAGVDRVWGQLPRGDYP